MPILLKRQGVPAELEAVYFDFYWSQPKLWNLALDTTLLEVSQLEWILDYPVWYLDPNPVPNALLKNPELDPQHWLRVLNADLEFPVHVIRWKDRLLVLDGIHRLMRAKTEGKKTIATKILKNTDLENILPDEDELDQGFLKRALAGSESEEPL